MNLQHSGLLILLGLSVLVFVLLWKWTGVNPTNPTEVKTTSPPIVKQERTVVEDTLIRVKADSIEIKPVAEQQMTNYVSIGKRILLVGDSQAEGLMYPLNAYCVSSGHTLAMAFSWYSSRVETFASNDTLKNLVGRVKPDYIIMVIGLNQVFQKNMQSASVAISSINKVFDTIPVSWIGPVNWTEDGGINQTLEKEAPAGTFFLSENISIPRASDNRHPTMTGYRLWMDSVAHWLSNRAKWKLPMIKPDSYYVGRPFPKKILKVARLASPQKKYADSVKSTPVDTVKPNN